MGVFVSNKTPQKKWGIFVPYNIPQKNASGHTDSGEFLCHFITLIAVNHTLSASTNVLNDDVWQSSVRIDHLRKGIYKAAFQVIECPHKTGGHFCTR